MSGYHGFSRSNNAVDAEARGLFPASAIAAKLRIPIAAVRAHGEVEKHHTSCRYNMTAYYDLESVREWAGTPEGVAAIAAAKAAADATSGEVVHAGVEVRWLEWSGTRRHPHASERVEHGATVTVRGQTATVRLADGREIVKRVTTRGFSWRRPANRAQ